MARVTEGQKSELWLVVAEGQESVMAERHSSKHQEQEVGAHIFNHKCSDMLFVI